MQEYVPALTWNEPTLKEFLSRHGYLSENGDKPPKNVLSDALDVVRKVSHLCNPHMLVWTVFFVGDKHLILVSFHEVKDGCRNTKFHFGWKN